MGHLLNRPVSNRNDEPHVLQQNASGKSNTSFKRCKQRNNQYIKKEILQNSSGTDFQKIADTFLEIIYDWFPELPESTYFLPPVHMNIVHSTKVKEVETMHVTEVQKTLESDWRDDEVMQRTLHCLRALANNSKEAMVVLQKMQHDSYVNKKCYAAHAKAARIPLPKDLSPDLKRGDFDILIIHRMYGLIVAEIKSVGRRPGEYQDDDTVVKRIQQALKQLNKAEKVLSHLVSDIKQQYMPSIRKTLILPNVSSERFRDLLEVHPDLSSEFCDLFNVPHPSEAISLCLCSDQMTTLDKPANVTDNILEALKNWWSHLVAFTRISSQYSLEVYELLVARFCGPASTINIYCAEKSRQIEFRTLGDAVSETGERMTQFSLFPQQLALLQRNEPLMYLTGPPGTGKTLVLMLIALKWVHRGHQVHITSTGSFSDAATQLIYHQVTETLQRTYPDQVNQVHLHLNGNKREIGPVLEKLFLTSQVSASASSESGQIEVPGQMIHDVQIGEFNGITHNTCSELYIIADEVDGLFREFFDRLKNNVTNLYLWSATYHKEHRPPAMTEEKLDMCLRCPPTVMRRLETAVSFKNGAIYSFNGEIQHRYPAHTDGPPELFLSHEGHASQYALDCEECGQHIAHCLRSKLHIGVKPHHVVSAVKTPATLQFRDVMVIPDWYQDRDDLSENSGIILGLKMQNIPVMVVKSDDLESIKRLVYNDTNSVAVVRWGVSNGLERKVVVSLGEGREIVEGSVSGVLHGASRCTAQLIYVRCPS